jgi:hypothetical protein
MTALRRHHEGGQVLSPSCADRVELHSGGDGGKVAVVVDVHAAGSGAGAIVPRQVAAVGGAASGAAGRAASRAAAGAVVTPHQPYWEQHWPLGHFVLMDRPQAPPGWGDGLGQLA